MDYHSDLGHMLPCQNLLNMQVYTHGYQYPLPKPYHTPQTLGPLMQGAAGNHSSAQVHNGCIEKVCVYIVHMLQPLASTQAPRPRVGGTEVIRMT